MIENFICPNGNVVTIKDCLSGCDHECLALSTRIMASKTRKWDGKTFSVTQLLQPTLQAYLKITKPETIAPESVLAAALGTAGHALLEGNMPEGWTGECRMVDKSGRITGQPDLVDIDNGVLYDFKFVAAFSLAKMKGMKQEGYWYEFKRGKRKGDKEWRYRWVPGGYPDYHHYDMQLNMYRILLNQNGIAINKMFLQAMAKESKKELVNLGLDRQAYLIEIPMYEDKFVIDYFNYKYDCLMNILNGKRKAKMCDETWNGRRCNEYCSVNSYCPFFKGDNK